MIPALPQETYDAIIDILALDCSKLKQDLANCCLASSLLLVKSQSHLFKNLEIYLDDASPDRARINEQLFEVLKTKLQIASYVQSMYIGIIPDYRRLSRLPLNNLCGFSFHHSLLPCIHEVKISVHAETFFCFAFLSKELQEALFCLVNDPLVRRLSLRLLDPPAAMISQKAGLEYLEIRGQDYQQDIAIDSSLPVSLQEVPGRLERFVFTIPELDIASLIRDEFTNSISLNHINTYVTYLKFPHLCQIPQRILDQFSESLTSLSMSFSDTYIPHSTAHRGLALGRLCNVTTIEFILQKRRLGISLLLHFVNMLRTLPSRNKLTTLIWMLPENDYIADEFAQLDQFFSKESEHFANLQRMFVSLPPDQFAHAMPHLSARGILAWPTDT